MGETFRSSLSMNPHHHSVKCKFRKHWFFTEKHGRRLQRSVEDVYDEPTALRLSVAPVFFDVEGGYVPRGVRCMPGRDKCQLHLGACSLFHPFFLGCSSPSEDLGLS